MVGDSFGRIVLHNSEISRPVFTGRKGPNRQRGKGFFGNTNATATDAGKVLARVISNVASSPPRAVFPPDFPRRN